MRLTYISLLRTYLAPYWLKALGLLTLLLINMGLQLMVPQITSTFIDQASIRAPAQLLIGLALLYVTVNIISQIVNIATEYVTEFVSWLTTNALREDIMKHCLSLDDTFHNARMPGELIERIDGDVQALETLLSEFILKILGSGLLLLSILLVVMHDDWRVGGIQIIFVIISALLLYRIRNIAVARTRAYRETSAQFYGFLEERLAGLDDIRANGGSHYVLRRFYHNLRDFFYKQRASRMKGYIFGNTMNACFLGGTLLILATSIYLRQLHIISTGTVYLFYQYTQMLRRPLDQIVQQAQDIQGAKANILRIQELFEIESKLPDGHIHIEDQIPKITRIQFDHVTFEYQEDRSVLSDLSFTLEAGKVLGLVGRTGSGKTTITRLLFRFYDVSQGSIRINGQDIRSFTLDSLRDRIALVTQDVQLFHATVRNNITFFDGSISDEKIISAINNAGLAEWYRILPKGLDTEILSNSLSAGQAQLLALARVFLQNPAIVILDEASSRLDPATEKVLERALNKLLAERIGIIIAHRLQTLQLVDTIMILEQGKILEYGSRAELIRDPETHFSSLLRTGIEEVFA